MNPLMMTLNLKEGYISLNDGTLEALGHPRQIQLRLNDEEASLALMPCTMNDAEAVVVPTDPVVRYSYNYLQWSSVIITITYEEAVSQPTVSSSSVNLGSAVTIYTNRQSTATTHTLLYSFGSTSGTIASNVGTSVSWTPPLSLASQIPSATSGICTITCQSYNGGTLTGTRTCTVTLNVPSTVVPSISSVTVEDTNSTVVSRIAAFVKGLSTSDSSGDQTSAGFAPPASETRTDGYV